MRFLTFSSVSSEEQRKQAGTREADLLHENWWLLTETTLRRFITANNCDVSGAQKQILAHLEWRSTYDVDAVVKEDFSDIAARNELYWRSYDLQDHPVLVWNAARHDGSEISAEVSFCPNAIPSASHSLPTVPIVKSNNNKRRLAPPPRQQQLHTTHLFFPNAKALHEVLCVPPGNGAEGLLWRRRKGWALLHPAQRQGSWATKPRLRDDEGRGPHHRAQLPGKAVPHLRALRGHGHHHGVARGLKLFGPGHGVQN